MTYGAICLMKWVGLAHSLKLAAQTLTVLNSQTKSSSELFRFYELVFTEFFTEPPMERVDVLRFNLLARARLLAAGSWIGSRAFLDYSSGDVFSQIKWLIDAGLATGVVSNDWKNGYPYARLTQLTAKGVQCINAMMRTEDRQPEREE